MIDIGQILIVAVTFLLSLLYQIPSGDIVAENDTQISVYFCPDDFCSWRMSRLIESSNKSVDCALYDLELENVIDALDSKNYRLIIDKKNTEDIDRLNYIKNDNTKQLMHNKFCVIDEKITITGSFNPTMRGDIKNNNNIIIIRSRYISENYLDEFKELYSGMFGSGDNVKYPAVSLDNTIIENYFCPEDSCGNHVIDMIQQANKSVDFMTFSFTHDGIGEALIEKHKEGITIRGVFEKSQNNEWCEYNKLKDEGMNVTWDGSKYNMHNKVFIIDDSIIVTGSFNPSKSGDEKNDENILIIHDAQIAGKYKSEFEIIWKTATSSNTI
ncbi:MAG: phospholipase D-like domain-containing protein [archaeon]|nr:phospholipase D-like domain-containing protein [archaeon]